MTQVVRVDKLKPTHTLYIGRAWAGMPDSKWANPYYIRKDRPEKLERDRVLALYEMHIRSRQDLMMSLHEIDDQKLGCWCFPKPCHGDVLIKLRKEQVAKLGNDIRTIAFGAN